MSYAPPTLPQLPEIRKKPEPWTARRISRPAPTPTAIPKARVTRRFESEWLQDGQILENIVVAPALPAFEQAFSAFTHGILIQTTEGPIAVEDLQPGMFLETASGEASQLLWKGSITIVPGAPTLNEEPSKLYRVMPDAFGLGRPLQDQTFGPSARRLDRDPKVRAAMGTEQALVPLSAVADGMNVIEVTPVSPTKVYHLVCESHETIFAAGMEVETYHPGPEIMLSLPEEILQLFMNFFPHLYSMRDFGRLSASRVSEDDFHAMF